VKKKLMLILLTAALIALALAKLHGIEPAGLSDGGYL
jgi:hypothetical protein